ncbi:M56 family metallopeptidase [Rhodanobacter aciditrophus]|uniref:M56 family metallopeptidase n=1 Tax=Rhodanobacter aciditrophus TaxID=1623218 RepID=UPI003CEC796D
MTTLDHLASVLLERLAWTSLQAALLVAAVALLIRVLPRLSAAARCALWWLVGLQVVLGLCWQAPIRLPLLAPPPAVAEAPVAAVRIRADGGAAAIDQAAAVRPPAGQAAVPALASTQRDAAPGWLSTHGCAVLAAAWLLLLLAQLPVLIREYRNGRRQRRDARATTDAALLMRCARQARTLGLRRAPAVLASPAIASPQVSGGWRPVVLWPAHDALSADEAALALAHELAHLRRGDLLLGWVPALAARLFFFHPLLRWAMREYALNREAACDALAVEQQCVAPQDYGRLLLRLGVAPPMHAALAGASPTFHNLKRRLTMLQQTTTAMPRVRGWLLVALVALIGVLPYRVVAYGHAAAAAASSTALPPPPPAPPAPPAVMSAAPPAPPPPGMAPPPPPPPAPPSPPAPPLDYGHAAHHVFISTRENSDHGFALIDGDSVTIDGSDGDARAVQQLRKQGQPLLWFRRGDRSWAIRDREYIKRAEAIYAPVKALARQQGELGGQQGVLGARQGELGARQGALGGRQGQFDARVAALAEQQARIASRIAMMDGQSAAGGSSQAGAEGRKALAAESAKIDAERQSMRAQQAAFEKQQAELGEQQAALGRQQEALGRQQQALGEQQRVASANANRQMDQLLTEALAKGIAQPVAHR